MNQRPALRSRKLGPPSAEPRLLTRPQNALLLLVAASAFFAPWGEGLQSVFRFDASKIFVVLSALLVACLPLVVRESHLPYNRLLRYWLGYLALHTLLVFGFWKPDELQWGVIGYRELTDGVSKIQEGLGMRVGRFFLFSFYGAAVSEMAHTFRARSIISMSFAIGINCVIALGGFQLRADPTTVARLAGGSLDPNAFGLSCAVGVVVCVYLVTSGATSKSMKYLSLGLMPAPLVGLLASGSRGSLLGLMAGMAGAFLFSRSLPRSLSIWLTAAALMAVTLFALQPDDIKNGVIERFSYTSVKEDRGSSRPELWRSYLSKLPEYALVGTGMQLAPSAISDSWDSPRMTHNIYLQLLVENGILGLALFVLAMYSLSRRLLRPGLAHQPILAGLLLTWLVASFFIDSFNCRESWFVLGLTCSHIRA